MDPHSLGVFEYSGRSQWIRLRTLIVLRWVAIIGQVLALLVAQSYFELQLEIGLCYLAVGTAIIANLIAIFVYPENKRLSEIEALLTLMFDLAQLAFLIYLTGGLNNPFALLVLTPVTIAATALRLRSVVILGTVALVLITIVSFIYIPLRTQSGELLAIPDIFVFGFWIAMMIGIGFLALYARRVSVEIHEMSDALLATQMALAREQKLTDLGGVVAAAAHELGTPLATITLVSAELLEELDDLDNAPDHLREDALLIRSQADRCRDILRSMGRAGKDDLHMRIAPLETVIREAAEPHGDRGITLQFDIAPMPTGDARQPSIFRRSEIIHGLRNLIQNAVDFAQSNVWIEARWGADSITLRIIDDGSGFPPQLLGRIGDPFVRNRRGPQETQTRPAYEGMGLGLFIAKTLLERSGAELTFANAADPFLPAAARPERCGALVEATWLRASICPDTELTGGALGENTPIEA